MTHIIAMAAVVALVAAECGTSTSAARDEVARPQLRDEPAEPPATDRAGDTGATARPVTRPSATTSASPDAAASPVGSWENGSCGDRKYVRRVTFLADGRFTAQDRVAPCPVGARCVWSGVIDWQGTWTLHDRTVRLAPDPASAKLPEHVPAEFEIMDTNPLSVAERDGSTLCPYRKSD